MRVIPDSKIGNIKALSNVLISTKNREVQINILEKVYIILTKYTGVCTIDVTKSSYRYYEDFLYEIHGAIEYNNWESVVQLIEKLDYHHNIFNKDHDKLAWWQLGGTYEAISRLR